MHAMFGPQFDPLKLFPNILECFGQISCPGGVLGKKVSSTPLFLSKLPVLHITTCRHPWREMPTEIWKNNNNKLICMYLLGRHSLYSLYRLLFSDPLFERAFHVNKWPLLSLDLENGVPFSTQTTVAILSQASETAYLKHVFNQWRSPRTPWPQNVDRANDRPEQKYPARVSDSRLSPGPGTGTRKWKKGPLSDWTDIGSQKEALQDKQDESWKLLYRVSSLKTLGDRLKW